MKFFSRKILLITLAVFSFLLLLNQLRASLAVAPAENKPSTTVTSTSSEVLFYEDWTTWPIGDLGLGPMPTNPQIWEASEIPIGSAAQARVETKWSWAPSDRALRMRPNTVNPKQYDGLIVAHTLPMTAKPQFKVTIYYLTKKTLPIGALEFQLIYASMTESHMAALRWKPESGWFVWDANAGPGLRQVSGPGFPADSTYHRFEMVIDVVNHQYLQASIDGWPIGVENTAVQSIGPEGQLGAAVRVYLETAGPWSNAKSTFGGNDWPEVWIGSVKVEELP